MPEALASLLRTVVVALFLLTFVLQPYLIPSESMEHTLLVGDFLLVNKQIYAPSDGLGRLLMPYREIVRGDIIVFHHPQHAYLVKRVVGLPGRPVAHQRWPRHGERRCAPTSLTPPLSPPPRNPFRDDFPAKIYTDPKVDPLWWKQMQSLMRNGELVVPQGEYFVLGDNRNHSKDSRFWGFVARQQIVARPLVIYFSLSRPSTTDSQQATDDRLGHDRELSARLPALPAGSASSTWCIESSGSVISGSDANREQHDQTDRPLTTQRATG